LNAFIKLSADDEAEAQKRLRGLLNSRKKHAEWFDNLDTTDPKILEVFSEGYDYFD
jgi:hypothetical protein